MLIVFQVHLHIMLVEEAVDNGLLVLVALAVMEVEVQVGNYLAQELVQQVLLTQVEAVVQEQVEVIMMAVLVVLVSLLFATQQHLNNLQVAQ